MGKAEENKKQKKSALLSHAFSLFMKNGILNTSISEITSHAGVAKGTFYFYFKDKEDLIEKLIAQKAALLFERALNDLNALEDVLSAEDSLIFLTNHIIDQLIEDSRLLRFLNKNLNYGISKHAMLRDEIKQEFDILAAFYDILEKDGSTWREPRLMLYTIVELVSSTCHSIILDAQPVDFEHYRPYLEASIRSIVGVFRVETPQSS